MDDQLTKCPSCDATFQVIIDAANPANLWLNQGGGYYCPMCGYEFDEDDVIGEDKATKASN